MDMNHEPARDATLVAGILASLLTGVVSWAAGADVRVAVGIAAGNLGAFITTGRYIRDRVFSPATHDRLVKTARKQGVMEGESRPHGTGNKK